MRCREKSMTDPAPRARSARSDPGSRANSSRVGTALRRDCMGGDLAPDGVRGPGVAGHVLTSSQRSTRRTARCCRRRIVVASGTSSGKIGSATRFRGRRFRMRESRLRHGPGRRSTAADAAAPGSRSPSPPVVPPGAARSASRSARANHVLVVDMPAAGHARSGVWTASPSFALAKALS